MKRWLHWTRWGLIAAASFVLLITVLPQVASGIGLKHLGARLAAPLSCSSGGSGSGSSGQCGPGTVSGTVTVTGAPSGFAPAYEGAGACPYSTSGLACTNPQYTLSFGGKYSLALAPGKWDVAGFYENSGFGGVFTSPPKVVTITSGGTVTANFAVPYQTPATLKGTITVTGVPSGVTVESLSVLLCPSFAPYTGGFPSIACVNGYPQPGPAGPTSASYVVTGLPPGRWTAFPSYCTQFGCATNANAGKKLTLVSGRTRRADVTTPFLVPSQGELSATVTVTGAPSGFSDQLALSACQGGGTTCVTFYAYTGNTVSLLLPNGSWTVQGLYLVPPFYNDVVGPSQVVTISGGHITKVNLSVPYQVLGGVSGTIRVTGRAPHVPITSYTVVACPSSATGRTSPQCINEYSGPGGFGYTNAVTRRSNGAARSAAEAARVPFNLYQLSTLTPGRWTLYPGYETVFGSFTDPVGTTVTITANQTVTQRLSVPYQIPSIGVVTGKVNAIGVPQYGFQSGVHACSSPPTGTSCPNEQSAYTGPTGTYTLSLAPGTWWVAGFVDVFAPSGLIETTSTAQPIAVTPGSQAKVNFAVKAG